MARKKATSRPNLPQETLERARREATGQTGYQPPAPKSAEPTPKKRATKTQAAPVVKVTTEDLAKEYAYVISDLRNMGILAAGLFAALILVSLILA